VTLGEQSQETPGARDRSTVLGGRVGSGRALTHANADELAETRVVPPTKSVAASRVTLHQLMLPEHANATATYTAAI
jgi:hypothetical protein